MTAHATEDDRQRCLAAGMDGYVAKPINRAELIETIWRLTEHRRDGNLQAVSEGDNHDARSSRLLQQKYSTCSEP